MLTAPASPPRRRVAAGARTAGLAVGYYALGRLGVEIGALEGNVAPIWLSTGFALAAMLLLGRRQCWAGVALGALAVNGCHGTPWGSSTVIAAAGTGEVLLAATILRRAGFRPALDRLRDVALLVTATLGSTAAGATIGVVGLLEAGIAPWGGIDDYWRVWWLGHAVGTLVITSAVLAWRCFPRPQPGPVGPEATALALLGGPLAVLILSARSFHPYLVFPAAAVAAFRYTQRGAATATSAAAAAAVYLTTHGYVPSLDDGRIVNLQAVDAFLAVLAASTLLLAAIVSERNAAHRDLEAANRHLEARIAERTLALERDRETLAEAQHLARMGSWRWEIGAELATWSKEVYKLLGVEPAGAPVPIDRCFGPVHPDHRAEVDWVLTQAIWAGKPYEIEYQVVLPSGEARWIFGRGRAERDAADRIVALHGVCQDITDRKRANEQFGALLESAPDAMVMVDGDGRIVRVNRQAERLFGYHRDQLVGSSVEILLPTRFRARHAADRTGYIAAPVVRPMGAGRELLAMRADGTEFPVEISLSPIETGDGVLYAAAVRDITQRRKTEEALVHQANHDALTRLPNRTLLLDRLEHALARSERGEGKVAVLFLDLDRFKLLNDGGGHAVGDQILVTVAERLRGVVRPGDTIARFGGDEFVVVCEDAGGSGEAIVLGDRIAEALGEPFAVGSAEVFLTVSIGIAVADRPIPAAELLRNADAAMYRAKEHGRARCEVYDDTMRAQAAARLEMQSALHRAIDREELRLLYQPIVDLQTSTLVGVEALVRWLHPEQGLVGPDAFVPLAEEGGLIVPIGTWILEEAARDWAAWRDEFPARPLGLSVNLSPRQFREPGLIRAVRLAVEAQGMHPGVLCLEVTESVFLEDADLHRETFNRLQLLGVRLAIDDFGTGFSSLTYLKRFPVDLIKVDQGFVSGLGRDAYDSAIVESVVELGHALGLRVVAEGIETDAQLRHLRSLGCDLAQGFRFAPPMDAGEIAALLRTGSLRWPVSEVDVDVEAGRDGLAVPGFLPARVR